MFKFLHAADIHLDSQMLGLERYEGAPVEQLRGATRRALDNLVQLALDEKVSFVVIAGDLYDGDWRHAGTGLYFVSRMRRLREAGIPVFLIAGNHDAASRMTRQLPLPENVRFLSHQAPETVRIESLDVAIHGQGFATQHVREDLSLAYPAGDPGCYNIGLLHTCATATGHADHQPYAPCTVNGLLSRGYDYWALGHIHTADTLHPDPLIVFPGNLQGRHARETGSKGCVLITVDEKRRTHLRPVALDVLRWEVCSIDAREVNHPDDLLIGAEPQVRRLLDRSEGRPLAVRMRVHGECPAHERLVAAAESLRERLLAVTEDAGDGRVWLEKVRLETRLPGARAESDGPVAEIVRHVEELRADPASLAALPAEFAELWNRLPADLRDSVDTLRLDDPATLASLLEEAQPLLAERLLRRTEDA